MFSSLTSPRMSPVFGGKELNSFFIKKPKDSTESCKYVNLNEPEISLGRKTMGKELQEFFFTSMDSNSEDDDRNRTNYKPSKRNGFQKSYSVESSPSSEDAPSSPKPESTFPVYNPYSPAKNRRRFTKIAGRTMKTVMSTLSPNLSKKNIAVPACSQEPVWPNSMNTFARGITTSKEQPTMSPPDEPSLASLRIQIDGEERELFRQAAAQQTVIFTGDLLRFDTPSPPNSLPGSSVLMSSYSDSDIYYPPCQKCMASMDQGQDPHHYRQEITSEEGTAEEGIPSNTIRIEGNHLVLTEGPPEDDFFA